jgi:predicted nucleic acid-binding protein
MLVIDASAALQWVFKDEASAASDRLFERVAVEGASVPAVFPIEFANVLVQAERRKRVTAAYSSERLAVLSQLRITVDALPAGRIWTETITLARIEGLTVYDASYLELAMRLGASLATRDQGLIAAAQRRGLAVLP